MFGGGCAVGGSEESFADLHYIDITTSESEASVSLLRASKPPSNNNNNNNNNNIR